MLSARRLLQYCTHSVRKWVSRKTTFFCAAADKVRNANCGNVGGAGGSCLDVTGSLGGRGMEPFSYISLSGTWDCQICALPPRFSSHWFIWPLTRWPRKRRWQRLSFTEISDSLGGKKEVSQADEYAEILGLCERLPTRAAPTHAALPSPCFFDAPFWSKDRREGKIWFAIKGFMLVWCGSEVMWETEPCGNIFSESTVTRRASMSPDGLMVQYL